MIDQKWEEIAERFYRLYSEFDLCEQAVLAVAIDLYNIPAEPDILPKTFLDGVQLGLVLSATQSSTAGQLLEFISQQKPNDSEVQTYAKILALLLEKLNGSTQTS